MMMVHCSSLFAFGPPSWVLERNEKKEVLEKLKRRLERLKKKVNLTNKDIEQSIVEFEKEVLKNSDINIRRA